MRFSRSRRDLRRAVGDPDEALRRASGCRTALAPETAALLGGTSTDPAKALASVSGARWALHRRDPTGSTGALSPRRGNAHPRTDLRCVEAAPARSAAGWHRTDEDDSAFRCRFRRKSAAIAEIFCPAATAPALTTNGCPPRIENGTGTRSESCATRPTSSRRSAPGCRSRRWSAARCGSRRPGGNGRGCRRSTPRRRRPSTSTTRSSSTIASRPASTATSSPS